MNVKCEEVTPFYGSHVRIVRVSPVPDWGILFRPNWGFLLRCDWGFLRRRNWGISNRNWQQSHQGTVKAGKTSPRGLRFPIWYAGPYRKTSQNPPFCFLWRISLNIALFAKIMQKSTSPNGCQGPFYPDFFCHVFYSIGRVKPCQNANVRVIFYKLYYY